MYTRGNYLILSERAGKFQNPAITLENSSVKINPELESSNEIAGLQNWLGREVRKESASPGVHLNEIAS